MVQGYIDIFGLSKGLAICKSLMCFLIILGVIFVKLECKSKGNRIRAEFLLYAGSFATFIGSSLWLTKF